MDLFGQWLAHTLSARTSYEYDPVRVLVRVSVDRIPDGVSCSLEGEGNFGRIKTMLSGGPGRRGPYPIRKWISDHPNERHRTTTLLYTDHLFLDLNEAKQLGIINGNS